MDHIPLDVSPEQRANLTTLAAFLIEKGDTLRFDMNSYAVSAQGGFDLELEDVIAHPCGAVGCAIGSGILAGIPAETDEEGGAESWDAYGDRAFAADAPGMWNWCFDSTWAKRDNTASGAGRRIQYALEHGVPTNHHDQMIGLRPLSYAVG